MNIIQILSIVAICISLATGLYILSLNPKNKINIVFFLITLCLAINNVLVILIHQAGDEASASMIYRTGTSFGILIFTLVTFFSVYISDIFSIYNIRKLQKFFLGIIFIYQTYLICRNFTFDVFVYMIKQDGSWMVTGLTEQTHFLLVTGYWLASSFFYILIMILWRIKTKSRREKKQAFVFLCSFFLPGFIISIFMVFIFYFFRLVKHAPSGDGSLVFFIWILGIGYCIAKYRFLSITPEYISKELISNIDESVILIKPDKKIISLNHKAKELINGHSINDVMDFSKIIPEHEVIGSKIKRLLDGQENTFNCRISYLNKTNKRIYMNARFSIVKDRFNDTLGILVIAKENKGLEHLKTSYKITDRQMDIVTMVLAGLSNKELAAKLMISERTVENHLVNIYNKLGVNNKIELYNMTQQYGIDNAL